ncbi:hypothetical protein WOC18_22050 [Vibrio parahaemolyticus]
MALIPNLMIQSQRLETRARYDLRRFLYQRPYTKSGKALDSRWFFRKIDTGEIGPPQMERLELILAIKELLETKLETGSSISTIESSLSTLQLFFDFFKDKEYITLKNLESAYLEYCEGLFIRSNKINSTLKKSTAYGYATKLSSIFGELLEIPVSIELINRTRLPYTKKSKKAVSRKSDKQNLEDISRMGCFLVDIVSGITIEKIYGKLPFTINARNIKDENEEITLTLNSLCSKKTNLLNMPFESLTPRERDTVKTIMKTRSEVRSIEGTKRHYFVSLRVQAEFLIFIAQTGMNVSQAKALKRNQFKYRPLGESWEVKTFKNRRAGEVSFKIYKSYKPFIKKYLKFIDHFFPESDLLFPWHDTGGQLSKGRAFSYLSLRKLLNKYNIPWISPQCLRETRVNWCLRRSSSDVKLTSEMHQHFMETLRNNYERPSQHRSMVELTKFWNKNDPIKKGEIKASLITSQCNGVPISTHDKPASIVTPNCINQSGCLWCENFRDIDSFDYIWSLFSFRYLKTIEASGVNIKETIPSDLVIAKLTEKIDWFKKSNDERNKWVEEAEIRIEEGDFHPHWLGLIEFLEG